MRILILDTYYPAFLKTIYSRNLMWKDLPYEQQWRRVMNECFGTADFYSSNLVTLGHEAREIVVNCLPLQMQWALEHGISRADAQQWQLIKRRGWLPWLRKFVNPQWTLKVLKAQVEEYAPDVLYVQDMGSIGADFLRHIKPHVKLVVGQTAYPLNQQQDLSVYDLILSSFPHYTSRFQEQGLKAAYFRLGFEPRILQHLEKEDEAQSLASFVGGLSPEHRDRLHFMENIAKQAELHIWGYGKESLGKDSPLRRFHHGETWALDMYRVLKQAALTLNFHINVAEDNANNMRLYEATGVGTLLITDAKKNLSDLFEPGKEVLAYSSVDECAEMIQYYLAHPAERKQIAKAGQARTLREHTYAHRMQELCDILKSYL